MKQKCFFMAILMALSLAINSTPVYPAEAATACKDYEVIFARGSGSKLGDADYVSFTKSLRAKLAAANVSYSFYELGTKVQGGYQYPAVEVSNLGTLLGAKVSAGRAFSYGRSVKQGIGELKTYVNNLAEVCQDTKFIIAGYSQGAQVVSLSLAQLPAERILYVATFGDPKAFFPEGKRIGGLVPAACFGKASSYRKNVPDCYIPHIHGPQ